jgi:hypothetical protein
MAKMFDRATIECNDDGTYSLSVTPPPKEKEGKEGEAVSIYGKEKRATCQSLEEIGAKIKSLSGEGEPEEKKMSDNEKLEDYFNGAKYTAEKEEE